MSRDGMIYTRPWLKLDPETVRAFGSGKIEVLPEPYTYIYPQVVFRDVADKKVLCLASGGGQQSAVFGILGARVTVLDLTQAQLDADLEAADHFGFHLSAMAGDMRDLSAFAARDFDLVYQPISICFVPDVREVYEEVARIIKPGAIYRVGHCNPATQIVNESSWDGEGYRIAEPIAWGRIEDADLMEFRHRFSDVFNGLVAAGFVIESVWEDPRHLSLDTVAEPGTQEHMLGFVQQYFAIVARRSRNQVNRGGLNF
jgi:SAM-dependent methyltransferase